MVQEHGYRNHVLPGAAVDAQIATLLAWGQTEIFGIICHQTFGDK